MDYILITGTSSGIGLQTAIELSIRPNTALITLNRSAKSSKISQDKILSANPKALIKPFIADFIYFSDVIAAAGKIRSTFSRICGIILNAGIMFCPYRLNDDGIGWVTLDNTWGELQSGSTTGSAYKIYGGCAYKL